MLLKHRGFALVSMLTLAIGIGATTAIFNDASILSGGTTPEQIATASVSPNFFSFLGVNAAIGRVFVPAQDGNANSNRAAVLSFEVWQRHFASDPNVLGTQF